MRILFVQPADRTKPAGLYIPALLEPLALECLAATVPDHEVSILDMRLGDDLAAALESFAPDVVAATALTTEVYAAQDVFRAAKAHAAEIFTVAGGLHATLLPQDFDLPCVDAICLGEGEAVFPQLIAALANGRRLGEVVNLMWRDRDGTRVNNGRSSVPVDMDALPVPRRDLTARHAADYYFLFDKPDVAMATGRGCPYRCNFCSVWEFYGGRTAYMSPGRVLDQIRAVPNRHITFIDDNFLTNYRRESEIAARLRAEGIEHLYGMECRTDAIVRHPDLIERWVDLGLRSMLLGLEGGGDAILDRVNKKNTARVNDEAIRILQANGVIIWGAFVVDPQWTADDFHALREYVTRMDITHTQFTVLTPLPGTQWHREMHDQLLTHDYRAFDTLHAVLPTRLPREEFYRHFADLYRPRNLGAYYDLIDRGRIGVDDCRAGFQILKTLSRWEFYVADDPVLGGRTGNVPPPAGQRARHVVR